MRLHVARHLRRIIIDSENIHSRGEERFLLDHRHKQIFRYVVENGSPNFFKMLVGDLIED